MTIRITDGYLSTVLLNDLNHNQNNMLRQQIMAGTMRRVNSYADDPRAVGTIQRYNTLISQNGEFIGNVSRSRILVDATDVALQNVSEVLMDVRVIALRESSAVATGQSMATSEVEVDNLVNRLLDTLNTSIEGTYIFAGTQTNTPPFVRNGDTVLYQGNTEVFNSRIGPNSVVPVNVPGDVFLGAQSAALHGTADLAPALANTTLLSTLNMGDGWSPGALEIADGLGNRYTIDLSGAITIGHVISAINTATAGAVTISIGPEGEGLNLDGIGPLTISDPVGSTTAMTLGISGTTNATTFTGRDVRARAETTTPLAGIDGLAANLPLGLVEVDWMGATTTVDFSAATTLDDLRTILTGAIPGMELRVEDTGITIIGGAPETFQIRNADATNTASLLGIEGQGAPIRLFGVLEDLKAALQAGDKTAVRSSVTELGYLEDEIYKLMMRTGGRQTDLDWADQTLRQRDERLRTNLSMEQDVDVAQVASDLSRAETSYQSSLMVSSRLYQMNLMQYLS